MMHVKTYFILYGEGFLLLPNYYHKKQDLHSQENRTMIEKYLFQEQKGQSLTFILVRIRYRNRTNRIEISISIFINIYIYLFIYYKGLGHMVMEVEISQSLQSARCRSQEQFQFKSEGKEEPVSQLPAAKQEEFVFKSRMVRLFVLFRSSTVFIRHIHIRECNLLLSL